MKTELGKIEEVYKISNGIFLLCHLDKRDIGVEFWLVAVHGIIEYIEYRK